MSRKQHYRLEAKVGSERMVRECHKGDQGQVGSVDRSLSGVSDGSSFLNICSLCQEKPRKLLTPLRT